METKSQRERERERESQIDGEGEGKSKTDGDIVPEIKRMYQGQNIIIQRRRRNIHVFPNRWSAADTSQKGLAHHVLFMTHCRNTACKCSAPFSTFLLYALCTQRLY